MTEIYNQYIHWAAFLVSRGCRWSVDRREVLSLACEVLMRTANQYDPESGIRFCSYARHRIEGVGRTQLAAKSWHNATHCSPSDQCPDPADIQYRSAIKQPDEAVDDCIDQVDANLRVELVRRYLKEIPPLTRRFILAYYSGVTLRELGRKHNLSHERIRQLIGAALNQLRKIIPNESGVPQEGLGSRTVPGRTLRDRPGQRLQGGSGSAGQKGGRNPAASGGILSPVYRRPKRHQHQPDVRGQDTGTIKEGV
jgi:RNA polymerase sigma factor (sigma-70 family)